ncbi:trans-aconitate 2-methyltransferase [Rhizobiaceae bacterium n13]|uniref:Trans-aconitate 2-methyltransferase n=1 Tax=Ferirhizobium litorale TaxID=2927786 RepID=A0AAE3QE03_9HYPH|nr:trans-aconitate 2-methyltransferase [Fererhizobium litorale]MDI7861336.1 trans-aconitate 2-methyltransferase [Fererhizobium litorale]MDI7921483.1 trans-aconitate 2-methyltransferase [Fererhizobium litorale]
MAWSAQQYLKFEDERTRPARDLLAQVPDGAIRLAFDLGCGPGNSTELILARFADAQVIGIDSDDDMLANARKRLPGLNFEKADLGDWQPERAADLFFANAVFQWLPDHPAILERLMGQLNPGGALAVQMPDNLSEPSHLLMEETARSPAWAARFAGKAIRRSPLPAPSSYYDRLAPHAARFDIWHTIYNHALENAGAIAEWVKATGLRPYLDALEPAARGDFLADYTSRIASAYPPLADGRVLLRFPRLFMVAIAP